MSDSGIVQQYFELIPRKTNNISIKWKLGHITLVILTAIISFLSYFASTNVTNTFNNRCIFGPYLKNISEDTYIRLPVVGTRGGQVTRMSFSEAQQMWAHYNKKISYSEKPCHFMKLSLLLSMVWSIIFTSFFILCSRGGAGKDSDLYNRPWRIVMPCIIFSSVSSLVMGGCYTVIVDAKELLCNFLCNADFHFDRHCCDTVLKEFAVSYGKSRADAEYGNKSWKQCRYYTFTLLCLYIAQLALCLFRIILVIDFEMRLITVIKSPSSGIQKVSTLKRKSILKATTFNEDQ